MFNIIVDNKTGLWSHNVPNQSPALIITSVLFLLVTTVFFSLRVRERWKLRDRDPDHASKRFKLDVAYDTMATAAYITLVVQTIFGGIAAHYGFGKHRADVLPTFPKAMHYFFLYQICYKLLGGFTKLTFCFLYLRAFVYNKPQGAYQRHFKTLVVTTAVVIGAGTFAFTVATIFQCTPIKRAWDQRNPGHCTNNLVFWFFHATFNTLMDIVVFILPIPVINGIDIVRRNKIGLISTFALGAFVIAASIARMVHLRGSASSTADPTWGSMPALIWTEIEANTAVIVCCCPALPVLVKRSWRRMRTFVGQSVSLDSGSHQPPSANQSSVLPRPGASDQQSPRKSQIRSFVDRRFAALWWLLNSMWRRITGYPASQDVDADNRPYMEGNFAYVYPGNNDESPRPWLSRLKPKGTHSWTDGDEEVAPVSYLAPKVKFGGIFKKNKDFEGAINQHQDVLVSTHRRSMLEQQNDGIEMTAWRQRNNERQAPGW